MNEEQYTLAYDPRVFAQKFKVRYSIIEQVFRHKGIPTYSKLLKRVMTRNLDPHKCNLLDSVVMEESYIE